MENKSIEVEIKDLADLHNKLIMMHPTGDDILTVADCILTLRKMIENSKETNNATDKKH